MDKKFKIGVIGTENSHAKEFTRFFNKPDIDGNFLYPDCHVTMVYGHYPEESEKVVKDFGADMVASSIDEMVKSVDAVMITARDGKFHKEFAIPFIEAGIPAFIDKPFTTDINEANEIINKAKEKGVPLVGGSSLKYAKDIVELKQSADAWKEKLLGGFVSAPLDFNSPYSGFWFYSSHLAEMCMEIFGWKPISVSAEEKNSSVQAVINYEKFSVNCSFLNGAYSAYGGAVFGKEKSDIRAVSLDNIFRAECSAFVEMLRTGKMSHSYEELIAPVYLLDAIERSYKSGKKVLIEY